MLNLPAPAALEGDSLTKAIAAALQRDNVGLTYNPETQTLTIVGVGEGDRETVDRVVGEHVPPPPPANPYDEFRKAVEAATTIADLKAALLGTTGPGAQPRRPER